MSVELTLEDRAAIAVMCNAPDWYDKSAAWRYELIALHFKRAGIEAAAKVCDETDYLQGEGFLTRQHLITAIRSLLK